ncbi:hypothetical protein J2S59_001216 [Nocardioides massiliensis]|uniref:ABC-2 type transport system permease protein n=1 Tax=Nocardioides massiliensis TaxID=1325935 RepID=A0ABT9NLW1_9ACTN|nr:hypothetical protein [Nocardioides massiliensis]MDP9821407.1 hypothetical protein [Nocardioides massiliensis]
MLTPTVPSWTERVRRSVADVGPLLRFRAATLRGHARRRMAIVAGVLLGCTLAAAIVPAYVADAGQEGRAGELLLLLPSAYLGVLGIAIVSAAAAGGGRELLLRDEGVTFPVSPTTDHLGSLLLAPLNIAWLLQTWAVLGATAYAWGPDRLLWVQLPIVLWVLVATAAAQVLAWSYECVRRSRHGRFATLAIVVAGAGLASLVVAAGRVTALLDQAPTIRLALLGGAARDGRWADYAPGLLLLVLALVALVALGAVPAHRLARMPTREESALETSHYAPRATPHAWAADLRMMLRLDRAGVWRSVPLRRGVAVLAVLPGAAALAGGLGWDTLLIMPGLVGSGGALLFGVNAWCLDGGGGFWRETLPVRPGVALAARAIVLAEVLLIATGVTVFLAGLRAGWPAPTELAALVCATVVVTLMVTGRALQWSVTTPYAADLRSARATPAPPAAMFGYSVRLASVTTLVSLLFAATSRLDDWWVPVLLAVPFVCFGALRLYRVARRWDDPAVRGRVVATVAG